MFKTTLILVTLASALAFAGTHGGGVVESVGTKLASVQFAEKTNLEGVGLAEPGHEWTCMVQGAENYGDPVGEVWQTLSADGSTEVEATSNAQELCFSQGLEECQVTGCVKDGEAGQ